MCPQNNFSGIAHAVLKIILLIIRKSYILIFIPNLSKVFMIMESGIAFFIQ